VGFVRCATGQAACDRAKQAGDHGKNGLPPNDCAFGESSAGKRRDG
jgi:hypothetical protein